jgi:hypothetical protein
MNTILFYTIVVIVILIVCFFLSKRMYNDYDNNIKANNYTTLETFADFTPFETRFELDLDTFFNLTVPVQLHGETNLEDLKNKSLQAKSHVEPNDKNSCHTKYTNIYDLFVLNQDIIPDLRTPTSSNTKSYEIQSDMLLPSGGESGTSLNDCLKKASYGPLTLKDGSPIQNTTTGLNYTVDDIEGVLFQVDGENTTSYYILKNQVKDIRPYPSDHPVVELRGTPKNEYHVGFTVLGLIVNNNIVSSNNQPNRKGELHIVKKNKFETDPAFIDFGVKGTDKYNIYRKKISYRSPNLYPYFYSSINTRIFNIIYNLIRDSSSSTMIIDIIAQLIETADSRGASDTSLQNNFSTRNLREKAKTLLMCETLFNRLTSNDSKPSGDNNPIISEENRRQIFLDSIFIDDIVDLTSSKCITRNLFYLAIVLVRLRTHIIKNNFLEKFNCKYFTYLFYSFNDGWNIFGNYIESVLSDTDVIVMKKFFDIYEFERLYKNFIASLSDKCNSIAEHSIDDMHEGLDVNSCRNLFIYNSAQAQTELEHKFRLDSPADKVKYCPRDAGTIVFKNDINLHKYFFYSDLNYDEKVRGCSQIKDELKCSQDLTYNQCSWNSNNNTCEVDSGFSFEKCMDYNSLVKEEDRREECGRNNSCEFNDINKMCYPKPCLEKDTTTQQLTCGTHNHCQNYPEYRIENDEYKSHCYDKERVMYATQSEDGTRLNADNNDLPQNFMTKVNTHLSDCTVSDRPLSSSCKNTAITSCKILDKNQPRHNPTEFETCVSDELIDEGNFYSCLNLKTKENCDSAYGGEMSCFWQDGKCYKRDAPLEWTNPNAAEYGLEDMTDCKNFISDFECPVDRCIWHWHDNKCIRKSEHPYYPTGPIVSEDDEDIPNITVPLDRDRVDCLLINNTNNTATEARNECLHNKCHWDSQKNLCMNDINRFCELHNSKDTCLDKLNKGLANFDPVSHQNKCRWVEDKSDIFKGDYDPPGVCIDTRMKQPCALFDSLSCPVEDKVDNMGNVIRGSDIVNWMIIINVLIKTLILQMNMILVTTII